MFGRHEADFHKKILIFLKASAVLPDIEH